MIIDWSDAIVLFADRKMVDLKAEVGRILQNLRNCTIEKGLVSLIREFLPKRAQNSVHNRIKYMVRQDFNSFRLKVLDRLAAHENARTPRELENLQFFEEVRRLRIAGCIRPFDKFNKKTLECMINHGSPIIVENFLADVVASPVKNDIDAVSHQSVYNLEVEYLMKSENVTELHRFFSRMRITEINLVTDWVDLDIVTNDSFVIDIILSDPVTYTLLNQNIKEI